MADALRRIQREAHVYDHESVSANTGDTTHLNLEKLNDHIYILENPINDHNIQMIFSIDENSKILTTMPFGNKVRRKITEPEFTEHKTTKILKNILRPNNNKTCAIYAPDEIFKTIQQNL